ncbi:MAG: ABC transporter ATP-binding protein [Silicimonas sp.]|nr:ABC transporter ATP-binding protein [Silicimonas sp.]
MLSLSNLTKRFGAETALDGVDLALAAGERVALLGHNGAGKTTLMKLVLGLIPASAGSVEVAGHAPGSAIARGLTAYLPENVAFHPSLTAREQIRHYLRLRGGDPSEAGAILEKVGLGAAADRRIGTYSKGMRQRVGLAQALIGRPRLMVLDEPTSGLDPVSRGEFYALLDDLAASGTAILLSSHALSEVEVKTDRLVVLAHGRKVAEGTLEALRAEAALPLTVHLRPRKGRGTALAQAFPEAREGAGRLTLTCAQSEKMALMARITGSADMMADFDVLPPSLDDIYAHISRRAA